MKLFGRKNFEEIISGAEAAVDYLPNEEAEELRQVIARILRSSKPKKSNLTREKSQALNELSENTQITILPADIGNATVVIDMEDYTTKSEDILRDKGYKQIKGNPTTYLDKTTKVELKRQQLTMKHRN